MDSFDRAHGRLGKPSIGNQPLMYTLFRHRHVLEHVCGLAEASELPTAYPPPSCLGVHIRAQGSTPCRDPMSSTESCVASLAFRRDEHDQRLYIETKYDGFRLQIHYERATDMLRFFYRSGIDCTRDVAPDLAPAMRLALAASRDDMPVAEADGSPAQPRFGWLAKAWAAAQERRGGRALVEGEGEGAHGHEHAVHGETPSAAAGRWRPPESVIFDGELLVYDEASTPAGRYDELGSVPGVVGFGTHFWVSVGLDQEGRMVGGRYSREDCRRHYMVKLFDILHLDGRDLVQEQTPLHERRPLLEEALLPIDHFVELADSELVDLTQTPNVIAERFAQVLALSLSHCPAVPRLSPKTYIGLSPKAYLLRRT